MIKQHFLTEINEIELTANCSKCGFVTIFKHPYQYKNKSNIQCYVCAKKLCKKVIKKHILEGICEKSKTAFCKNCGLVRIQLKKGKRGNNYWKCNRAIKGKIDRKKDLHRANKKSVCEECGFIPKNLRQLDIHHIDENHYNDNPENMQTLCHNCHRLKHIKTYEQLDGERIAGLLERRWLVLLNPPKEIPFILANPEHKNTKRLSHKLSNVCEISRTGYCSRCGLVSIILRTDKQRYKYWCCNHGGKKQGYGKEYNTKYEIKKRFFNSVKKEKCEQCGFEPSNSRQLDIHHIDGNHSNNEIGNLKTLCANCHRAEHDFDDKDIKRFCEILTERWSILLKG